MNAESLLALERLELIMNVDTPRAVDDPFKLSPALLNLAGTRRLNLSSRIAAASLSEGDRAGASLICRGCLTRLESWHRVGCRYLDGLLPDSVTDSGLGDGPYISDAMRLQLKTAYGFEGNVVGTFTDDRTEHLALLVVSAVGVPVANAAWHYPQSLRNMIAADYSVLQAHQTLATGGSRQVATAALTLATEEAQDLIARVRGAYISGSDLGDRTPELAKIGLQPRRQAGEAGTSLVPDAPGTAVYNAVAKTLTIPGLPANTSSLRAYRQPAGGARELCGISLTSTVSTVMTGPLDAGVAYEVWVVGVLGDREGPESNRVAVTG